MSKSKIGAMGGNDAGLIVRGGVMTATAVLGPYVIDLDAIDQITFDLSWTGTPTGVFLVEVSNSYLPNPKDLSGAPIRAGNWKDMTSRLVPAITQPAGAAGSSFCGFPIGEIAMGATYVRIRYTNASGVGALDAYVSGKAVG